MNIDTLFKKVSLQGDPIWILTLHIQSGKRKMDMESFNIGE